MPWGKTDITAGPHYENEEQGVVSQVQEAPPFPTTEL